jgi:hypothetical protein
VLVNFCVDIDIKIQILILKMNVQLLTNGNLELVPTPETKRMIKALRKTEANEYAVEAAVLTHFLHPKYEVTSPASVGALTSATLLTDGKNVYGDMNYQVESFLDTMLMGQSVIFQKG